MKAGRGKGFTCREPGILQTIKIVGGVLEDVNYVLIGGIALQLYLLYNDYKGPLRDTDDLDIDVESKEDAEKIKNLILELDDTYKNDKEKGKIVDDTYLEMYVTRSGNTRSILEIKGLDKDGKEFNHRVHITYDVKPLPPKYNILYNIKVAPLEYIAESKKRANREKDRKDLETLVEVGLLEPTFK